MRKRILLALLLTLILLPLKAEDAPKNLEQLIVDATNEQRKRNDLPPLRAVPRLADCARLHSQEMAQLNYFSHKSPTEGLTTPHDRVDAIGLHPLLVGENIYSSSGKLPADAVQNSMNAWMKSPGHRANILADKYSCIGVGMFIQGADVYVTQVFSTEVGE